MQKADDNHENSDHESDLEFDPWEEEEFLDDPIRENLEEAQLQEHPASPQDTSSDLPPSSPDQDPKKPAKKRSSSGLLLLILVIAGGGAGGYYYLSQNSNNIDKPIVCLDSNINSADQNTTDNQSSQSALQNDLGIPTPSEDAAMQGGGALQNDGPLQTSSKTETPVLTPFPENIEESTVELAPLDESIADTETVTDDVMADNETDSITSIAVTDSSSASVESEKPPVALEEDDLLSKTEQAPSPATNQVDTPPTPTATSSTENDAVSEAVSLTERSPDESSVMDSAASISNKKIENTPAVAEKNTVSPATKPKPEATVKEQVKQPVIQEKAPEWEIRGANPQSAVLYEKNSGETRTVEPGDSVKGLGKITKIAKENGLWVVTGTQNKVKQ